MTWFDQLPRQWATLGRRTHYCAIMAGDPQWARPICGAREDIISGAHAGRICRRCARLTRKKGPPAPEREDAAPHPKARGRIMRRGKRA